MWEWRFDAFSGLRRALAVMQRSQIIGGSSGKPEGKLSVTPTIAGSEVLPWSCGEGAHLRLPAVARNVTCGNGVLARLLARTCSAIKPCSQTLGGSSGKLARVLRDRRLSI
jgi:hypothetical protein